MKWWFHRHAFVDVVVRTYAPPTGCRPTTGYRFSWAEQKMFVGVTTVILRCRECGATKTVEMLGRETEDVLERMVR